ncbi:MAG TPA: hypothetical protein PLR50_00285 [Candidatus Rifleibacterium sp.]|nr:hypothetical protein [Candidatus Rifleibacterium sp.]
MKELEQVNRQMHEALIAAKDALEMAQRQGLPVIIAKTLVCLAIERQEKFKNEV